MVKQLNRFVVLAFVLALVAAACGQKPGTHVTAGQGGDGGSSLQGEASGGLDGGDGADGTLDGTAGDASGTADGATGEGGQQVEEVRREVTGSGGGDGGGTDGGGTGGGGTGGDGGDGDGTGGDGGGTLQPQGSDRTGVSEDTLTLGIHAPVTGAAPLPTTSFENLRDIYWRWKVDEQGESILGRSDVEVLFEDDKYNPSKARQVCRELASRSFLLVGGGGTDQIQACGDLSNSSGVPYLSAGVTERGLRGLPWYFATSMSYKQQGDLLGQYVSENFPGEKVAMIVTRTRNFEDAVDGWEAAVERYGIDYYGTLRHDKGDSNWYHAFGNELKSAGVSVVYMLTAPVKYIDFAQQNQNEDGMPGFQYVGVGITMGLNAILPTGCPAVNGGIFFSPFPGLDYAREHVPDYFEAAETYAPDVEADDLGLALWMLAAQQDLMFDRYQQTFGDDLTREDFRAVLERQSNMETGIGPTLDYTPDDHFGANQVHVLQADCSQDPPEYVTLQDFAGGF